MLPTGKVHPEDGGDVAGWRAADQEPVASRAAIARGMEAFVAAVDELAAAGSRPSVLACWQDAAYLDVPDGLLDRLAASCDLTIACVGRARVPDGVHVVELDADEGLAAEWSLIAVGESGGAALVANEVPASLPAATVEAGRAFRYDTTDDPRVVVAHARRLQRTLGARLAPEQAALLAAATTDVAGDADIDAHVDVLTERVAAAVGAADEVRREGTAVPPSTHGLAGLADWLADAGPRAPSLGMIVVRSAASGVATALRDHAHRIGRVGDIIVDVPPDAAMLVAPGLHDGALENRADEICALLVEQLGEPDVDALAVDVPAERARRDLVGSLGMALVQLRQGAQLAR